MTKKYSERKIKKKNHKINKNKSKIYSSKKKNTKKKKKGGRKKKNKKNKKKKYQQSGGSPKSDGSSSNKPSITRRVSLSHRPGKASRTVTAKIKKPKGSPPQSKLSLRGQHRVRRVQPRPPTSSAFLTAKSPEIFMGNPAPVIQQQLINENPLLRTNLQKLQLMQNYRENPLTYCWFQNTHGVTADGQPKIRVPPNFIIYLYSNPGEDLFITGNEYDCIWESSFLKAFHPMASPFNDRYIPYNPINETDLLPIPVNRHGQHQDLKNTCSQNPKVRAVIPTLQEVYIEGNEIDNLLLGGHQGPDIPEEVYKLFHGNRSYPGTSTLDDVEYNNREILFFQNSINTPSGYKEHIIGDYPLSDVLYHIQNFYVYIREHSKGFNVAPTGPTELHLLVCRDASQGARWTVPFAGGPPAQNLNLPAGAPILDPAFEPSITQQQTAHQGSLGFMPPNVYYDLGFTPPISVNPQFT